MYRLFIFLISLISVIACDEVHQQKGEKSLTEIKAKGSTISKAEIVRDPVLNDAPVDTNIVARMEFDNVRHRYGEVEEGTIVTHTWAFKNSGKAPLVISNAKSTCGCTVPEWPKEPIPIGGTGEIFVKFDTKNKENFQTKPIFITANTHPTETTLYLMGKVKKKVEKKKE